MGSSLAINGTSFHQLPTATPFYFSHTDQISSSSKQLSNRLVQHLDGSLEIIPKTPAEVIGEKILRPILNKSYQAFFKVFHGLEKACNAIDGFLEKTFSILSPIKAANLPDLDSTKAVIHEKPENTTQTRLSRIDAAISSVCSFFTTPPPRLVPDCLFPDCADLEKEKLHPRELEAIEDGFISVWKRILGTHDFKETQEWLRFRQDDKRGKLLYLSAENDHNGALKPGLMYKLLKPLNDNFDIKYRAITSYQEICQEVRQSKASGNLIYIVITGHGYEDAVHLYDCEYLHEWRDFNNCFSNLSPQGGIILISCSTGKGQNGDPRDNIAQKIADIAKRVVKAPTNPVAPAYVELSSSGIYHPKGGWFSSINLFKTFYPRHPDCFDLREEELHPTETAAYKAITDYFVSIDTLPEHPSFKEAQDFFRFCTSDPNKKLLFLSVEQDKNKALDPSTFPNLLVNLNDRFDLKFKIIQTHQEICLELRMAAKIGDVAAIIIHSSNLVDGIKEKEVGWFEWLFFANSRQFPACLSQLPISSRIVLLGDSLGLPNPQDGITTIANKIAIKAKRTVIALNRDLDMTQVDLTSRNIDNIYHRTSFFSGKNAFKRFDPPIESS